MTKRLTLIVAGLTLASSAAAAQGRPVELGVDAGVTIGLGDNSVTQINIPANALRVGFFVTDQTEIEPQIRINTISGGGDTFTSYLAEVGLLYHFFRNPDYPRPIYGDRPFRPRNAIYIRPFAGFTGFSGGGENNDDSDGFLGAGLGVKIPMLPRLASRFEVNFQHVFSDPGSNALGLLAGLSFFTR